MTSRTIDRLLQTAPFLLAVTIGTALAWPLAAASGQDPKAIAAKADAAQKVTDDVMGKAANGDFDVEATYTAYIKAGLTINEANAATDEVRDAYKKWQKQNQKDDPNIQHGDLDFGQVYRGEKYPATLTLSNGCKMDQPATLTYPRQFKMTGPREVTVPANSTKDIEVELDMTVPTPPTPPFPRPIEFVCIPMDDILKIVHKEIVLTEKVEGGTQIYKCLGVEERYTVTLHAHQHPPVPPPPKDEIGGGKKKPPKPACKNWWDHGDFIPAIQYADPTMCREDIRDLASQFFNNFVEEEKVDRSKYEWLPKKADIEEMTEKALLDLKHRAVQQLRGGK